MSLDFLKDSPVSLAFTVNQFKYSLFFADTYFSSLCETVVLNFATMHPVVSLENAIPVRRTGCF